MNSPKSGTGIFANTHPVMSKGSAIVIVAFVLFTIIAPTITGGSLDNAPNHHALLFVQKR